MLPFTHSSFFSLFSNGLIYPIRYICASPVAPCDAIQQIFDFVFARLRFYGKLKQKDHRNYYGCHSWSWIRIGSMAWFDRGILARCFVQANGVAPKVIRAGED